MIYLDHTYISILRSYRNFIVIKLLISGFNLIFNYVHIYTKRSSSSSCNAL